jgi:crotonobetaine/carnitine-CoA ligase
MRDDGPLPQLSDQDPISVQFTSGTTSRPKGVLWTHANALWTARVSSQHENLQPWDVHHTMLPLFHTNALAYSWLASLWVGATVVLQPKFSANRFWDVALRHKCTWSSIGAFMYNILKEAEIPKHHFRHWGNAFWNPTVVEVFGVTPISWYGMTETLTHAIVSTPFVPTPYGAIGRPAPEYGVHILREDGTPVDPGETGALMLRGRPGVSLFKEYLGDAAATAGTYTDDGLFDTGDQVVVLEDGNIKFGDRKKDMLKTGGENVSASEVEAVIMTVEGVTECAVIGRPDRLRTEVPVAFVTVGAPLADRPDEDVAALVIARCRERLAKFKVPQGVTILEDFPRSTLNKIAKAKLRDLV